MDFLDEIKAEHHQDLLENGNLKGKTSSWTGENQWIDGGYNARVHLTECQCGAKHKSLYGIFHTEFTPTGKRRDTALKLDQILQFPPGHKSPILVTVERVKICADCIIPKGFQS